MAAATLDPLTAYLSALGVEAPDRVAPAVSGVWGSLSNLTTWDDDDPVGPAPHAPDLQPPPHLSVLLLIGRGGMGEVWRAYDNRLHRVVALKALSPALAGHPGARRRFLREAQATAQLAHPGIVPIYEVGLLGDQRPYFTMKVVEGDTLARVLLTSPPDDPVALRRRVDHLRRVAEALAYAHHRGVIHRDLKPANVMVGAFGEVLLLDWGIAKKVREVLDPVVFGGESGGAAGGAAGRDPGATQAGTVAGTPGFMAPEQAAGAQVDARTDVWALGRLLRLVLGADREGPPPPSSPAPLVALAERLLDPDPAGRPPHAGEVAAALTDWLDGAVARQRGLEEVAAADALRARISAARAKAAGHRERAAVLRQTTPVSAPVVQKRPLWDEEDAAAAADAAAEALQAERVAALQGALSHRPDLPEALDALAHHHRAAWEHAEAAGDGALVALHAAALDRVDRGQHAAFRRGDGAVTLHTDPPGARVTRWRVVEQDRRRVGVEPTDLGPTPLDAVTLPMGSWVLRVEHPDCAPVTYPVFVRRQQHWDGVAPGGSVARPIRLPRVGELGADDRLVPAGWFACGESRTSYTTFAPHDRWVDGMVVRASPVTVRDHLAFLNDLVERAGAEAAWRVVPRERASQAGAVGSPNVALEGGRFVRRPDADGDLWSLDWPILNLDWPSVCAFARWEAARTGLPWRLPGEFEWEKAARGVDGRAFAWGDHPEPTYACVREAAPDRPLPADVQGFPHDTSPYGVRHTVGNVREWCATAFSPVGAPPRVLDDPDDPTVERVLRGGCWFQSLTAAWAAGRFSLGGANRSDILGFRLVRSWD